MQQYFFKWKRHRENKNTLVSDVENKCHMTISIQKCALKELFTKHWKFSPKLCISILHDNC